MSDQFQLACIAALQDNYIWVASRNGDALAVDPGEAEPVIERLRADNLALRAIIITHKHADHVGGLTQLHAVYPDAAVFGPAAETVELVQQPLAAGTSIAPLPAGASLQVLNTPGHTRGHISLYGAGALFCGDALFSCGCGRLFEGDENDLDRTMRQFARLDGGLQVCCGHEYTLANINFALAVEPGNADLQQRAKEAELLRAQGKPTLPVALEREFATNPFLRADVDAVRDAACRHAGRRLLSAAQVLGELRRWKDSF